MTLAHDIDLAIRKIRERLDAIDEEIGLLLCDVPGDPGFIAWPRQLEDALDALHDEREQAEVQLGVLLRLRPQAAA